jgi:hypothetical protein
VGSAANAIALRCAEDWTRHALQARRSHLVKSPCKMLAATRKARPASVAQRALR